MISAEGEEVPFQTPVICDGSVENWMTLIEDQMMRTLNKQLYTALIGFTLLFFL